MEHRAADASVAFHTDAFHTDASVAFHTEAGVDFRVDAAASGATVSAVLAVKNLGRAKSRLAATLWDHSDDGSADRGTAGRASLVLAMFLDTVDALRSAGINRIVVVSPDDDVLDVARRSGTTGLLEEPAPTGTGPVAEGARGLNAAFGHGARWVRENAPESTRLLFIQADLPAATGRSLGEVLDEAAPHRLSFVADRDGTGTVLLYGTPDLDSAPRFGPGSAAAHRAGGAVELDPSRQRWPDLRTDVDTASDLEAAGRLGFGRHTRETLRRS